MFHTRINKYIIKVYVNITINIVFFLVMYNINLHIESLPWKEILFTGSYMTIEVIIG